MSRSRTSSGDHHHGGGGGVETAVPTLRVMRLQSPELHMPTAGVLNCSCMLHGSMCLPDSLGVYVGETFTAYLGVLNVNSQGSGLPIRRLTVAAQLQTPSHRWQLPSKLDSGNLAGGVDVAPQAGLDAIVSHDIEEAGQHILRVEVGYQNSEGGSKTFRKFYRFQVVNPLTIREMTVRAGDSSCFVSVAVEYSHTDPSTASKSLVISRADFMPADGLSAKPIGTGSTTGSATKRVSSFPSSSDKTALALLDGCRLISQGDCFRYLFVVEASSMEAIKRGIAAGDFIGTVVFTWRKAMGETGRIPSSPIYCPAAKPSFGASDHNQLVGSNNNAFVVHRSGLSIDVAAAAAARSSSSLTSSGRRSPPPPANNSLSNQLPVTVEPIQPPARMVLNAPREIQFLAVNHSDRAMNLQLQMRLSQMTGLAVCGPSFKNLGEVRGGGASAVVSVRFLGLAAGLLRVQGCCVVDLVSGREIVQPPLFNVFVEKQTSSSTTDTTTDNNDSSNPGAAASAASAAAEAQ